MIDQRFSLLIYDFVSTQKRVFSIMQCCLMAKLMVIVRQMIAGEMALSIVSLANAFQAS